MKVKHYYAVLSKYDEGVIAEFPDIDNFRAIGSDFAHAYRVTSREIQNFFDQEKVTSIKKPSTFEELKQRFSDLNQVILPVAIQFDGV